MENDHLQQERATGCALKIDVTIDTREVYLLILLFLSDGPCQKALKQLWMELSEYDLLPRRYHAWYSRSGEHCGIYDDDDGLSVPLTYEKLVERYVHIEKDHLVKLLKQLLLNVAVPRHPKVVEDPPNSANAPPDATYPSPNAADALTLLGFGSFSLLNGNTSMDKHFKPLPAFLRGPNLQANPVHAISSREIGGGFAKHHRAPSNRSACSAIAKPSTIVQRMDQVTKLRGHRAAVYCAIFDRSGRYVITGSDDRLVKIWSMETAFCLASCRGHEGDITDLAVSSNGVLVASASNDFIIRVWRLPDGYPISVLRGHTGAVTAITFSPRPGCQYHLLSSSDDGTCRIWDAKSSQNGPRIYLPKPTVPLAGTSSIPPSSGSSFPPRNNRVLWCAYNANGTTFVTGSSDTFARVWRACVSSTDQSDQPIHEIDILSGHENDVNYVQFSGCAVASRFANMEILKQDSFPKLRNPWFCHDYIVTCSRDGSAIIWSPRSRRSNGQPVRWSKLYQMKVPGPQLPPRPPRGGPRQRTLPTPRGVNMIIWSLDNRFVLAAIMDCRICIWDAENGSLVHTLIGHTASSYVLDVHPFNPKIAMSAGYDGSAKIWDIWEGILLHTYEVGPFKLVDGKFSPDGTSIVLSDDVGHLHLINTGQGEALSDAKYDQFFLGDYRPLIHDTAGSALDQETQLPPHKRNMQDPLCDSSMMPYPEPYQTTFQKRRLGILGVEWHSSSRPFVAHSDFSLGQDYQMPPLEDWDRSIEPVAQFADIMNWEPEDDVVHDDTDSEYNVAEEFTSEDERASFSDSSSSHPRSSAEDSDAERRQKNIVRRSRRKLKPEVQMTASGKQVKKRNSSDCDAQISGSNKSKKLRTGRKVVKGKGLKPKPFRPQRASARNAQDKRNREAGISSDGDDVDILEADASSCESEPQYLNAHGCYSKRNLQDVQMKEKMATEAEDILQFPQTHPTVSDSRKLIIRLPSHVSKRPVPFEIDNLFGEKLGSCMKTSTGLLQGTGIRVSPKDPGSSSTGMSDVKPLPNHTKFRITGLQTDGSSCSSSRKEIPVEASSSFQTGFDSQKEGKIHPSGEENQLQSTALQHQDALMDKNMTPDRICRSLLISSTSQEHVASEPNALAGSSGQSFDIDDTDIRQPDQGYHADLPTTNKLDQVQHYQNLNQNLQPVNTSRIKLKIKPVSLETGIPKLNFADVVVPLNYRNHPQKIEPHEAVEDSGVSGAVKAENSCKAIGRLDSAVGCSEAPSPLPCRTRSMKAISKELSCGSNVFTVKVGHGLTRVSENVGNRFVSEGMPNSESLGSSSRSRQDLYPSCNLTSLKGRNSGPPKRKLSWLIFSKHEEGGRYIPQLGDEVVYLRQGHQEYIEANPAGQRGPWTCIKGLKAVEICRIENLNYGFVASGDSCCKMQFRVVDPSSDVFGETFFLTLTELIDFPDFIVEKKRFDAAINRNWTQKEMCRVWWRNENGEGGRWWEGWIQSVKAKSPQFLDSPWERFTVQYTDTNDEYRHSPWELQDLDSECEHPQIDIRKREKLLSLFDRLHQSVGVHQDRYGVRKLNEAVIKLDFCNRYPVPLCPEDIYARLENNYYRAVEAVKHDIQVMLINAQKYYEENGELSSKLRHLSDWFERKLSKL